MKRIISERNEDVSFWMSIGDLMSGLVMVFILIMAYAFLSISSSDVSQKAVLTILEKEFKKAKIKVDVDKKTGAIIIKDKILFDSDKVVLKQGGEQLLQAMVPILSKVILANPEVKKEIISVQIEGYAASRGFKPVRSMKISMERSLSVWKYILTMDNVYQKDSFLRKLKVVGMGNMNASSTEDLQKDRKVVFYLEFRNLLEKIIEIFQKP